MSVLPEVATEGPLARLFADPRVVVAEMDPRTIDGDAGLFPEESAAVERAVLTRRQQFAAGRILARRAWQRLGQAPVPLLNDERRVPVWPSGIVGTITHTQSWCAAAVARKREVMGLGADVEPATPLEDNLWERICRPEEREFLAATRAPLAGLLAKGIFSAKESIYKALYPKAREFLDFQSMHIALESTPRPGLWRWRATLQVPWGSFEPGRRFPPGQLQVGPDLTCSAILIDY